MSLLLIYKDDFIADRQCVADYPHAAGLVYHAKKLQTAGNKTFAFATAGPTQTEKEKNILEAILVSAFRNSVVNEDFIEIPQEDWFGARHGLSLLVMTRTSTYWGYFPNDKTRDKLVYVPAVPYPELNWLVRVSTDLPVVYGTGGLVASMAVQEGVKIEDLTNVVTDVVYTVSEEYDHVRRGDLKEFPT